MPIACVFQPVVSLASGRVVGYEALARFPGSSMRTPDIWFAQAHGCGLGPELEAAAIRAAMEPLGRPLDAHLAINVGPSALSTEAVQRTLRGNLEGIVVEITEHEFVPDDDSLQAAVADLRQRGAQIAIDDAGAGHAGLKQLMRVRPDIVKIDQALIRDIHTDPARMALVESFVRFARDVGATVCAEGIESLDELAVLADLDVQWGQGYALARPSEPWVEIAPEAAELCRTALAETFRSMPAEHHPLGSSDRRLVHVSARLAGARTTARPRGRSRPDRRRARRLEDLPLGLARRTSRSSRPWPRTASAPRTTCSRSTTTRSAPGSCASRRRCRSSSAIPTPTRKRPSCCSSSASARCSWSRSSAAARASGSSRPTAPTSAPGPGRRSTAPG